jgi:hypothetical protein
MTSGEQRDLAVASSGDTASKPTLLFFRVLIVCEKPLLVTKVPRLVWK